MAKCEGDGEVPGLLARGVCVRTGAEGDEGLDPPSLLLRDPTRGGSLSFVRAEPREPEGVAKGENPPPSTEREL
jgi:hypothetical protein